ncbi:Cytoplasmic tRNA 2-thiolation protein 2 [Thoreauomyces humboldtii]|nr:Cytoplasmic tRNA 2-thiolation protein 2 [Thoreauomyces humboldtii]
MCSVEEGVDMAVPKSKLTTRRGILEGKCHKCKDASPVVDMKRVQYCRACFVKSVVYRANLATMRGTIDRFGEKLLVATSGGPSSSLLLEVFKRFHAIDPGNLRQRRKFSDIVVCHVDTSAVLGRKATALEIERLVKASGLSFLRVPLESVFENLDGSDPGVLVPEGVDAEETIELHMVQKASDLTPIQRLQRCMNALGKATAKEDMLELLVNKAILRIARKEGCSVVAVGDSSTRMAVKVLSMTSKGRGFALPVEMTENATWYEGMRIIRPLRDILSKEVAFFNRFENVSSVISPDFTTGMPARTSIDRLIETFVVGLQNDFPMTVNTVVRTASKVPSAYQDKGIASCPLCDGPVQPDSKDWRTRHTVTHLPEPEASSTDSADTSKAPPIEFDHPAPGTDSTSSHLTDVSRFFCYSCQNICRDVVDTASTGRRKQTAENPATPADAFVLPGYIDEEIKTLQSRSREWMKSEISDFLID